MANNVIMPLNPPITLVKREKLEKTLINVNVSYQPHKKKSFRKVVRTQVNHSTWDYQLFCNLHAFVIFFKFGLAHGVALKRFLKCQCEHDNICFHFKPQIPNNGQYC
jgi:hypothetical protein